MTKAEMVDKIAKDAAITKVAAEKALGSFLCGVSEALKKEDKVTFVGFGSFGVIKKKARTGRNPQTGAEIKIAAKKAVKFTPGKALKEAIQEKGAKAKKKK
ncbi:MAG TPA: HU family DNA-binding protein [Geobacteraceae bacterium]